MLDERCHLLIQLLLEVYTVRCGSIESGIPYVEEQLRGRGIELVRNTPCKSENAAIDCVDIYMNDTQLYVS